MHGEKCRPCLGTLEPILSCIEKMHCFLSFAGIEQRAAPGHPETHVSNSDTPAVSDGQSAGSGEQQLQEGAKSGTVNFISQHGTPPPRSPFAGPRTAFDVTAETSSKAAEVSDRLGTLDDNISSSQQDRGDGGDVQAVRPLIPPADPGTVDRCLSPLRCGGSEAAVHLWPSRSDQAKLPQSEQLQPDLAREGSAPLEERPSSAPSLNAGGNAATASPSQQQLGKKGPGKKAPKEKLKHLLQQVFCAMMGRVDNDKRHNFKVCSSNKTLIECVAAQILLKYWQLIQGFKECEHE